MTGRSRSVTTRVPNCKVHHWVWKFELCFSSSTSSWTWSSLWISGVLIPRYQGFRDSTANTPFSPKSLVITPLLSSRSLVFYTQISLAHLQKLFSTLFVSLNLAINFCYPDTNGSETQQRTRHSLWSLWSQLHYSFRNLCGVLYPDSRIHPIHRTTDVNINIIYCLHCQLIHQDPLMATWTWIMIRLERCTGAKKNPICLFSIGCWGLSCLAFTWSWVSW